MSRQSTPGKLPLTLQVRALEPIKKGALILVPAFGELWQDDDEVKHTLRDTEGVVHQAMLSHVALSVYGKQDRRRKAETKITHDTHYKVLSPLLAGKAAKLREVVVENLAPFWAVLRCPHSKSLHNMELTSAIFRDSGLELQSGSFPKTPLSCTFNVEVPIMRNVAPISQGDVLCLPFTDE